MAVAVTTVPGRGTVHLHPLLFVHGPWQAAWVWREAFTGWFAERGWTCHTFDLRHHGGTDGPRSLRRTRIRDYVADLADAITALGRPPVIVAHSMGGLVAQRYLERDDLPGCVLLAPVPIGGVWRTTLRILGRHPLKCAQAGLTLDLAPLVDTQHMARDLLFDPDIATGDLDRYVDRLQGESYLAYLDMLLVTRLRPPLVHTPVGFVTGDRDRIFSVEDVRRTARAYGVEATVIAGAGHQLMMGPRWEQAARAVESVLAGF
ncbi:MAG: alpha/beta hydrolase [Actinomycetota bacterium]